MNSRHDRNRIIDALEASAAVLDWMCAIDAQSGELRWVVFDEWSGDLYVYDSEGIADEIDGWTSEDRGGE